MNTFTRTFFITFISFLITGVVNLLFNHTVSALDTGITNLEIWGYIQNDTAFHTTTNSGTAPFFQDKKVAPNFPPPGGGFHPASILLNRLVRENKVNHRSSLMKFENTFNLKALYKVMDCPYRKISIFGRIYLLHDAVYDLTEDIGWRAGGLPGAYRSDGTPARWYRNDLHNETFKRIFREFYMDYNTPQLDIRIGKQMIVWGEIDGFRLLDLVNPFDLREFILDDYEDSRIPQWSLNVKWRFLKDRPDYNLEFIFIPDFEPNKIMREGSTWEPDELKLYYGGNRTFKYVDDYNIFGPGYHYKNIYKKPAQTFENSNFGLRFNGVKQMARGALSYSVSYYYTWDYSWFPFVKGWFMPGAGNVSSHESIPGFTDLFLLAPTTIERKHTRNHVFGATFNKVIGKWAFRGEAAYTRGKMTAVDPLMAGAGAQDFASKKDTIDYCLGFDKNFFTDWFTSGQIIQSIVLNANPHMVKGLSLKRRRDTNTFLTFVVQKLFNNDQMGFSSLIAYGAVEGEWWLSPKFWWEVTQNIKGTIGANIFEGDHYDTLGQFNRNDQIYIQLRYSY